MKKRTIISLIIMLLCVIASCKLWFIKNPLQISFDAIGEGNTKFEFFLNKKNNNEFKNFKYGIIEANLDETSSIELFINRISQCKRIKIAITNIQPPPPRISKTLVLSDFSLRYGKYKLNDLKSFKAENAKLKIAGNDLIVIPLKESFSLIYDKPVDIKSSIKFDVKILLIITILTFLISYKLTSYLADFKTMNNASRIDIVFLFIFFLLLTVPSHKINNEDYSGTEYRSLAQYKSIIKDNIINTEYGKNTESWFNDRFYQRINLIKFYINTKYILTMHCFQINSFITNKNNGWMFDKRNKEKTKEVLKNYPIYIENLHKLDCFCQKNKIKLYLMIIPQKDFIYSKENEYINKNDNFEITEVISTLQKEHYKNIKILYPYNILKTASKKDYVFYKTDHHWTDTGAYLAYLELMNTIKNDFKYTEAIPEKDFIISENTFIKNADNKRDFVEGITYRRSLIHDKKLHTTNYKYLTYKYENKIIVQKDTANLKSFYKKKNYKVYIIGNSFSPGITPFISSSFREVIQHQTNNGIVRSNKELSLSRYKKELKNFKPDIFIICIHTGYISHLEDLFTGE